MNEKKGFLNKLFGNKEPSVSKEANCACGGSCMCGGSRSANDETSAQPCQCGCHCEKEHTILILGSGCKKCQMLESNTKDALQFLPEMQATIKHVTDFAEIAQYGVMTTPALVYDGTMLSCGSVLSAQEIAELLKKVASQEMCDK